MSDRDGLGPRGEEHAAVLLKGRGDRILERNFRCARGELDLVTWDRNTLVFTEVRARHSSRFGHALESVTPAKQRRVVLAAQWYLSRRWRGAQPACRFDVVAIEGGAVNWIRNAIGV